MTTTYRVWLKDDFDEGDADERDESAMELRYDYNVYTPTRIGRSLRCPCAIGDVREAAKVFADFFHAQRDGWECTWPVDFVVHDGAAYFVVEVERDMVPEFRGGKPRQIVVPV